MSTGLVRHARRVVLALSVSAAVAALAHFSLGRLCRMPVPAVSIPREQPLPGQSQLRRLGNSYVVQRNGLFEAHLRGSPEQIGFAHSRLFYPEMVENEGILLQNFSKAVPSRPLRALLLDLAQFRYRHLGEGVSPQRQSEIAAGALGFVPDPYASVFPTYQRFVYLNALYDIALSFEHSPLIGCTTFVFSGGAVPGGGSLLARNFDFEVDPIFDQKKAVFFVHEDGQIPFASVAWPGLVGVVSGINREGVAVVVHGGRAGEPRAEGEPVVHALRAVLSRAHDTNEALSELARRPPLVSHIVVLTDAAGRAVKVERVPGSVDAVTLLGEASAVTNHFSGPAASSPKNLAVRKNTSTLARKARADELVALTPRPVTEKTLVALLRDRRGLHGRPLAAGDRNAIDAMIATHGVVMDTHEKKLWVSVAPHLLGPFVGFDLKRELADTSDPNSSSPQLIEADPLLSVRQAGSAHAPTGAD